MNLYQQLKNIDYQSLPISEYSRHYILRMLPTLDYYMDIYDRCLNRMLRESGKDAKELVMVDYGGGHGFLSCAAKARGVGKVIYVDFNSLAVQAVKAVSQAAGVGPDVVLHGDAEVLRDWCGEDGVKPDYVLGMDVIEHIYRLEDFFAHLFAIRGDMRMIFTTGSTPFNPVVAKRLRKVMLNDELGENGFRDERRHHIQHSYRQFTAEQLDYWAENTRGLTYDDAVEAVSQNRPNVLADPYNTCDPATGSWTERILPMKDYERMVAPYGARVRVDNGFYNAHRRSAKGAASAALNLLIRVTGLKALSPFIIIRVN